MFVYKFLPVYASLFMTANSLRREIPNSVLFSQALEDVINQQDNPEGARRNWISWTERDENHPLGVYGTPDSNQLEFDRPTNRLEISKSVELAFDPKIQAFVPPGKISKENQRKQAEEKAILLFSQRTYDRLKEILKKVENEKIKPTGSKGEKNFQTGRFKLSRFKKL